MAYFRERVKTVEAVQFQSKERPWPEGVRLASGDFDHFQAYVVIRNVAVGLHDGDYLVLQPAMAVVPRKLFEALYEELGPDLV